MCVCVQCGNRESGISKSPPPAFPCFSDSEMTARPNPADFEDEFKAPPSDVPLSINFDLEIDSTDRASLAETYPQSHHPAASADSEGGAHSLFPPPLPVTQGSCLLTRGNATQQPPLWWRSREREAAWAAPVGASGDPPGCCCPAEGEQVGASPPSPRGVVFGARASRHLTTLSDN